MARTFTAANSEALTNGSAPVTAAPFTLACWFKPVAIDTNYMLMFLGDASGNNANSFQLIASGGVAGDPIRFRARPGSTSFNADTSSGFSAGQWHHACGVSRAADDRSAYIDGGSEGTETTSAIPSGLDEVALGQRGGVTPSVFFDGSMAEAAIWNVALTAAEVAVLADGFAPLFVRPENLVFYAPLNRAKTGNDSDVVGGLPLTDVNTVTATDHPAIIYPPMPQIVFVPAAAAAGLSIPVAMHHYTKNIRAA